MIDTILAAGFILTGILYLAAMAGILYVSAKNRRK